MRGRATPRRYPVPAAAYPQDVPRSRSLPTAPPAGDAGSPHTRTEGRCVMSEQLRRARPGRFLMAVIDGGGTLPPAMGLAAELVRRGHVVGVLADPTVEQS